MPQTQSITAMNCKNQEYSFKMLIMWKDTF